MTSYHNDSILIIYLKNTRTISIKIKQVLRLTWKCREPEIVKRCLKKSKIIGLV